MNAPSVNATCRACRFPCKQEASVSIVSCTRGGVAPNWPDGSEISEIGEGHGDVRPLRMPYWRWVGLHLSKPLKDLEIEAIELESAEARDRRERLTTRAGGRAASPEAEHRPTTSIRVTCTTLRRVVCPECGQVFEPSSPSRRYCSDACARAGARKKNTARQRRRRRPVEALCA